jgi:hypothetical protein
MQLVNDVRVRVIGILVVATLRLGLMLDIWTGQPLNWWGILENTLLAAICIWEASRAVVVFTHRQLPLNRFTSGRFGREALLLLLVLGGLYSAWMVIYRNFVEVVRVPLFYYVFGLFYTYLYGLLVAGFYELLFYMDAWQKANREAEELKKANLSSQLDSLKNQVKPHFLFNSLNTLTALVEKDTAQAVKFIAELSKVYRYLLQSNEKELISLASELQFTQAYFFLLETRFGAGITMSITNVEPFEHYLIPPLTLQMLLENAVKHNQVSISKPLTVCIGVEDSQWLTVTNNVQKKRVNVPTNGLGLTNITTKYKLMNQPDIEVLTDDSYFTVKVPLIQPVTE